MAFKKFSSHLLLVCSTLTLNKGTCSWVFTLLASHLPGWACFLGAPLVWPPEWRPVPLSFRSCESNKSFSLSSTSPWCYSVSASDCSSTIFILSSKSKNKQETDQFLERHKFQQLTQENSRCCCNLHLLVIEWSICYNKCLKKVLEGTYKRMIKLSWEKWGEFDNMELRWAIVKKMNFVRWEMSFR